MMYLLFIPAWWFIYTSLAAGDEIARRALIAPLFADSGPLIVKEGQEMNRLYAVQCHAFRNSITIFCMWLVAYLLWWVFSGFDERNKEGG